MRALLIAAAVTCLAGQALAAPVDLKADTVDGDGRVTLSDLFDGAGAAGAVLVAARPGPTAVLDASAVQSLARRSGLEWSNPQGLRRIVVRSGGEAPSAAAVAGPAASRGPTTSRDNVEVLTWARSLATGEVVQPQDLIWAKAAAAPADAPGDADAVIGLSARRPLRAGAAITARDVAAAQVIKTGDLVTVTYVSGGITLALQGKAMATASVGDQFPVQNTASKKIIQAVATGPGAAAVGPEAQSIRAPARSFASR